MQRLYKILHPIDKGIRLFVPHLCFQESKTPKTLRKMKTLHLIPIFLFLGLAGLSAQAQPIYVKAHADGVNDGSSWADAFSNLQDALSAAEEGSTIWVASGTYRPAGPGGAPSAAFHIKKNLHLLGGFAGWEIHAGERDPAANPVLLSGDLKGDDVAGDLAANRADNVHTILIFSPDITNETLIDGFTFSGGHADGPVPVEQRGGGLYSMGAPIIRHCVFRQNFAEGEGAGLAFSGTHVRRAKVENCRFEENGSVSQGGGLFAGDIHDDGIYLTACIFRDNSGDWSGGAYIYNANCHISDTHFLSNRSDKQGGGLRALYTDNDKSLTLDNCRFEGNRASFGGGLYFITEGSLNRLSVTHSSFSGNEAAPGAPGWGQGGGGLGIFTASTAWYTAIEISGCSFTDNTSDGEGGGVFALLKGHSEQFRAHETALVRNRSASDKNGGGMYLFNNLGDEETAVEVDRCAFVGNEGEWGGGLYLENASCRLYRSNFVANKSEVQGGGARIFYFYGDGLRAEVSHCVFDRNLASVGGGLYFLLLNTSNSGLQLAHTVFSDNHASERRAGWGQVAGAACMSSFQASGSSFSVEDCTFRDNSSTGIGGGLGLATQNSTEGQARFSNNLFTNNRTSEWGGALFLYSEGEMDYSLDNCRFTGNEAGEEGGALWASADGQGLNASASRCVWEGNSSGKGGAISIAFHDLLEPVGFEYPEDGKWEIDNSLFAYNNSEQAVIHCKDFPGLSLSHCTLADNQASSISLAGKSVLHLRNSILYNPGFSELESAGPFVTLFSEGGNLFSDEGGGLAAASTDRLQSTPLLNDNYHLLEGSPAIDGGIWYEGLPVHDLAGQGRMQGGCVDIGAFESAFHSGFDCNGVSSTRESLAGAALSLYPNPASNILMVEFPSPGPATFNLQLLDIQGKLLGRHTVAQGEPIEIGMLPTGVYWLKVIRGGVAYTGKFVKL